jgi:hypothetical protein
MGCRVYFSAPSPTDDGLPHNFSTRYPGIYPEFFILLRLSYAFTALKSKCLHGMMGTGAARTPAII